jgi:hypothetical protein
VSKAIPDRLVLATASRSLNPIRESGKGINNEAQETKREIAATNFRVSGDLATFAGQFVQSVSSRLSLSRQQQKVTCNPGEDAGRCFGKDRAAERDGDIRTSRPAAKSQGENEADTEKCKLRRGSPANGQKVPSLDVDQNPRMGAHYARPVRIRPKLVLRPCLDDQKMARVRKAVHPQIAETADEIERAII